MPVEVDAIYNIPSDGTAPNPLRDALPPPLSRERVLELLKKTPEYSEADRDLPAEEKYRRLDRIIQVFFPLTHYTDLWRALDRAMRNSYEHRNPMIPGFYRQIVDASTTAKNFKVPAGIGKADCSGFSISGDSGIGKSHAAQYIMELTPQVITHKNYNGTPFPFRQVPWIKVNCPPDGSTRALCVAILKAFDAVLGTPYEDLYDRKGVNANKLMSHIERIACFHGTGIVIIDELQYVALGPSGGAREVLAFFSQLMHCFGLPVILIGTADAIQLLSSQFSQARRATGYCNPIWTRLAIDDPDWKILLSALWRYQYTSVETKLDPKISEAMHSCTQGVADNVAKLLRTVQEKLIFRKKENQIITPLLIVQTATKLFGLQARHLDLMSSRKLAVPEPDRKDGRRTSRDYFLPEEMADLKKKQIQSNDTPEKSPEPAPKPAAPINTLADVTSAQKDKKVKPPKPKRADNPIYGASETATKSGQSISQVLADAGFAVKINEFV